MKKNLLAAAFFSAFVATPTFAADSGAYVGLDLSQESFSPCNNCTQPNLGYIITGGYSFTQSFAGEIGYTMGASAKSATGLTTTANTTSIAAVGTFAINDMFALIAKLGYAMNSLTGDAVTGCGDVCSQNSVMYGVGAQYNVSKQVGVRLQYVSLGDFTKYASGTQSSATAINLGAILKF